MTERQEDVKSSGRGARALLLTVLGEFTLPDDEPVWTAAAIRVLGLLDVHEAAARQALTRAADRGWIASERVGRAVRWRLTAGGRSLLDAGAERIYSSRAEVEAWPGSWLLLIVSVPESRRELRSRLRTRLGWAGFGQLTAGVWISPHEARAADAITVVRELGLDDGVILRAVPHGLADGGDLARRAWSLDQIDDAYVRFIGHLEGQRPTTPDAILAAQVRLVHAWRLFPYMDPGLPDELLPPDWSGARAAAAFRSRHAQWSRPARARFAELNAPTEALRTEGRSVSFS